MGLLDVTAREETDSVCNRVEAFDEEDEDGGAYATGNEITDHLLASFRGFELCFKILQTII